MIRALREHWPEYLIEAAGLGTFMFSACVFATLVEFPGWASHHGIDSPAGRRALMGLAMGLTAIGIIYSRWGQRSGAHINPAVTLTFLRLGKITPEDSFFYVAFQFFGGFVGVWASSWLLLPALADPAVNFVVTVPSSSATAAFWAEASMSFGLMGGILWFSNHPRLAPLTGLLAGTLVAAYIFIEAPISGMSINPARTFGSAVVGGVWTAFWIYVIAPTVGMLLAAQLYIGIRGRRNVNCAKLNHGGDRPCIFDCRFERKAAPLRVGT